MPLNNQIVLITGGTGSFGRKFVELALREFRPRKVIVFSRDELKQHQMRERFPDGPNSPMRYFIGDVRDKERLHRAFHGVDIVVHAAALKHVPVCEYNPFEAIQTNVVGAKNVIDVAIDRCVKKVIAVSTDKAVNPVNLYGASKLCAEKLFVQGNAYVGEAGTVLSCTRYGNVIGSRGSVIQVFLQQRESGAITVTDARMTRFWLTLEQGVRFVIGCLARMHGGEIFVPKIPSMSVMDVARSLAPQCKVSCVGIRSGEKMHELLVSEDEARHTVDCEHMYVIRPAHPWWRLENWVSARPLPEGFAYASNTNTEWLTLEQFRRFVDESVGVQSAAAGR